MTLRVEPPPMFFCKHGHLSVRTRRNECAECRRCWDDAAHERRKSDPVYIQRKREAALYSKKRRRAALAGETS